MSKRRFVLLALVLTCFSIALLARRRTPHVPTRLLTWFRLAELRSLDPIDAHTHISQTGPAFAAMLESLHMQVLDILYMDDTYPYRSSMEQQKQDAIRFVAASKGRGQLCTTFDPYRFNSADFATQAIQALNQDFSAGAVAVKIWKNIGMELKNSEGQFVMPDDPRFAPIYQNIAEHHKTLIAHLAEPDAAWEPRDPRSIYGQYFAAFPQWDMSKNPDAPRKQGILRARDHLLALYPDLRVVGAHLGSTEDSLDDIANCLRRYPNFAVDTAARVASLVVQPRDQVREFILTYQDRILYGTDLDFSSGRSDQEAAQWWRNQYVGDWRYFATGDTFDYGPQKAHGLELPRSVLKKLFHDNAVRWIPGIDGNKP